MKRFLTMVWALALVLTVAMTSAGAEEQKAPEEQKVTGSASLGVFNRYIFRGYELGSNSAVIQPALSISYYGFSAAFWGNIDTDEHPTQSFVPDRRGQKSWNETDLTLSYTYPIGKLSLTGGYIYYGTKYANETEELYIGASYDVISKPTLMIYRDINEYSGTYINLSFSHSQPVYKDITVDLGASFGYFIGDDDYWNTFEESTGAYTGKKYEAFHDGMVKVGVSIPVTKNFVIQPVLQYWFPLSDKAKRTVGGNSYNFNGKLDETFVYGINLTLNF